MIPFGFIDDGSSHIEVLEEREKDHWQIKEYDPLLSTTDGVFNKVEDW